MQAENPFQVSSILKRLLELKHAESQAPHIGRPNHFDYNNDDDDLCLTNNSSGDKDIQNLREISTLAYDLALPYYALGFGYVQINLFPDWCTKNVICHPDYVVGANRPQPPVPMIRHLICNAEDKHPGNSPYPRQPSTENATQFNEAIVQYGRNIQYLSLNEVETVNYLNIMIPELIHHFSSLTHIYFKAFCPEIDFENNFGKCHELLTRFPSPSILKIIELIEYQIPKGPGKLDELTTPIFALFQNLEGIYFTGNLRIRPEQVNNILDRDPRIKFEYTNTNTKRKTIFTIGGFKSTIAGHAELLDKLMENMCPYTKSMTLKSTFKHKAIRACLLKYRWAFCKEMKLVQTDTGRVRRLNLS